MWAKSKNRQYCVNKSRQNLGKLEEARGRLRSTQINGVQTVCVKSMSEKVCVKK